MTAVAMLPMSCGDVDMSIDDAHKNKEPQQVGFYAGGGQTRTEMLENGLSAVWVADDQIALWARSSSGSFVLSNQIFKTYGLDSQRGFFSSELASAMPDDTYIYYCCYPVPASVNGTAVTFDVPAVQDGRVSGGADIMIATPVQHGALAPIPEPEDHSGMSMRMNRMMHQFRFYIPAEDNEIGDDRLERIILTFPSAVRGKVTLDLADPDVPAVVTEPSSQIELRLSEPLAASRESLMYACVAFVPKQFSSGDFLQIKAYTKDRIAYFDPIDLCARNFKAGHSTPVMLDVKSIEDYPYRMTFMINENNLGENLNAVILTAPEGCIWGDTGSNVYRYEPGHKIGVNETFSIRFEDEAQYRAFGARDISITYDSDNAVTYQTLRIGDLSNTDASLFTLKIPYLFYEDFSGISTFSDGHDNPTVGAGSDTWVGITDISSYTSSLNGWYGARVAGQSGTALRICCRYEDVLGTGAYYKGRLYTPMLSAIKDGKLVNVSVSFKYAGNRDEMKTVTSWWPIQYGAPDKSPILYFGINYEDTITNPDSIEGDLIDSITGLIAGSGYRKSRPSSLSPMVLDGEYLPKTGGSYTSFAGTKNLKIEKVDNGMRLGWVLSTDNTAGSVNANYWFYIDDIKVKIAN